MLHILGTAAYVIVAIVLFFIALYLAVGIGLMVALLVTTFFVWRWIKRL